VSQESPTAASPGLVIAEGAASLVVDERLFPREAVHGACYLFLDRCYLFLTRPEEGRIGVRLRARTAGMDEDLERLAGEFANELLNQTLRIRIGDATARIREQYLARAFPSDAARPAIDAIVAELEREEPADPLDIAVPWGQRAEKGRSA
jgi:His-Xaa-Ser system protein HxsD